MKLYLFCLFLSYTTLVLTQEYDVIVVGAGYAGLAAGKYFNGHKNFLILEANDYIGGRVDNRNWYGESIPLGAGWVHHPMDDDNMVTGLAKRYQLSYYEDSYDASNIVVRYGNNGTLIPEENIRKSLDHIRVTLSKMEDLVERRINKGHGDVDVKTGLRMAGFVADNPLKNAMEYFLLNFENGIEPDVISSITYGYTINEHEWIIKDKRGYAYPIIRESMRYRDRIKLRKRVNSIQRTYNEIYIIKCSDGTSYMAKNVLITVSTGVLQAKSIQFTPPLPAWKTEALNMAPMCHYCKIFLKFKNVFWDNDKGYIMLATERKGHYVHWQNLNKEGLFPGSKILLVTLTGDICQESYTYTDLEIMQQAFEVLKRVYPNASKPTDILRNDFSINPNFRGSYSYQLPGINEDDYLALEHPIQQSLYFAGEAYARWDYGFTHTAYQNGWDAAKNITKCMKNEDCLPIMPKFTKKQSCKSASKKLTPSLRFVEFLISVVIVLFSV